MVVDSNPAGDVSVIPAVETAPSADVEEKAGELDADHITL